MVSGYTPWTARRVMVRNIAPFVGRFIPLIVEIILAADVLTNNISRLYATTIPLLGAMMLW